MRPRLAEMLRVLTIVGVVSLLSIVCATTPSRPDLTKVPAIRPDHADLDAYVNQTLSGIFESDSEGAPAEQRQVQLRATLEACMKYIAETEKSAGPTGRVPAIRARVRLLSNILGNNLLRDETLVLQLMDMYAQFARYSMDADDVAYWMDSVSAVIIVQQSKEHGLWFLEKEVAARSGILKEWAEYYLALNKAQFFRRGLEAESSLAGLVSRASSPEVRRQADGLLQEIRVCTVGRKFPAFRTYDISGQVVDSVAFAGRNTVLVVTLEGCGGCEGVPDEVRGLRQEYTAEKLRVVLVASGTDKEVMRSELVASGAKGWGFPVIAEVGPPYDGMHGVGSVPKSLWVQRWPSAYLIGEDGVIASTSFEAGGYKQFVEEVRTSLKKVR